MESRMNASSQITGSLILDAGRTPEEWAEYLANRGIKVQPDTIRKRANALRGLAERSKPILGGTFIAVGLMLLFKVHYMVEAWALDVMPIWLQDLSVMF